MELTKRQYKILTYIQEQQAVNRANIEQYVGSFDDKCSKITILRDLEKLIDKQLIKKEGSARSIKYYPVNYSELLTKYDIEEYFKLEADKRDIKHPQFNFGVFNQLKNIFSKIELKEIETTNNIFIEKTQKLTPAILKKEFERLMIELSWKSSQIEGNTYSLLDTEILIKENVEAQGHKKEEATMILNHKKALDYIYKRSQEEDKEICYYANSHHLRAYKYLFILKYPAEIIHRIPSEDEYEIDNCLYFSITNGLNKEKPELSKKYEDLFRVTKMTNFGTVRVWELERIFMKEKREELTENKNNDLAHNEKEKIETKEEYLEEELEEESEEEAEKNELDAENGEKKIRRQKKNLNHPRQKEFSGKMFFRDYFRNS